MHTVFDRSGWDDESQHGAQTGAARAWAPTKAIRDPPPRRDRDADRAPVRLADEGRLRLGALAIEPALRRVVHDGGGAEIVEPRVMQVLVALVRAEGRILSRDELLAC